MFCGISCASGEESGDENIDTKEADIPENGKFHNSRRLQKWMISCKKKQKAKGKERDSLSLYRYKTHNNERPVAVCFPIYIHN